jgi:hypothetical protein
MQAGMLGSGGAGVEVQMPLSFLKRLQDVQLPVRVASPEELHHVSVLLATGLIGAEFTTLSSATPYAPPRLATVTCITRAGHAELAAMSEIPVPKKTTMEFSRGYRLM